MNKSELAREYRDKYGMEMNTLKLARIMYADHNLLFKNVEDARTFLRAIEGKAGKKIGIKATHKIEDRPKNPYSLPESHKEDRPPFKLPKQCNNILVISDLHFPYQDNNAITLALDYGVKHKVNTIFINGDLVDFHQLSKFQKDPRKRSTKEELKATKEFLIILRNTFPNALIYWLKGNHDVRYENWLMTKVFEIFDDEYYHLEQRLQLNEQKIHLIDDKVLVKIGKLNVTHGHHIFKGIFSPVSPARGAFMRAKKSILVGHLHRSSKHSEIDIDGKVIMCYSTSCLCELRPDYNPLVSNSMHGFAHITVEANDDYDVRLLDIIDGKVF